MLLADFGFISQEVSKTREVVLKVVLLQPKSVFNSSLEGGRLQDSIEMLDGGFRSLFDEGPATTLAQLEVPCLEHEDAKARSGSETSRRTLRLTSAKASSNDTGLLPPTRLHRRFLMISSVIDIGVALSEER